MTAASPKSEEDRHFIDIAPGRKPPAMVGIAGFSGSGKTTLVVGLVTEFSRRGLRVGTVKHDAHDFEIDRPGKDSWRHKQAGAAATIVSSPSKIGMVMDADHDHRPHELLPLLSGMDLVLFEGFKHAPIPKIEVFRPENRKPPACRWDPNLIAVVSDAPLQWGVPRFGSRDFSRLADFIASYHLLHRGTEAVRGKAVC